MVELLASPPVPTLLDAARSWQPLEAEVEAGCRKPERKNRARCCYKCCCCAVIVLAVVAAVAAAWPSVQALTASALSITANDHRFFAYTGRWTFPVPGTAAVADWPCVSFRFRVHVRPGAALTLQWQGVRVRLNATVLRDANANVTTASIETESHTLLGWPM